MRHNEEEEGLRERRATNRARTRTDLKIQPQGLSSYKVESTGNNSGVRCTPLPQTLSIFRSGKSWGPLFFLSPLENMMKCPRNKKSRSKNCTFNKTTTELCEMHEWNVTFCENTRHNGRFVRSEKQCVEAQCDCVVIIWCLKAALKNILKYLLEKNDTMLCCWVSPNAFAVTVFENFMTK